MTTYNECLTLLLNDGRVIVCKANGYEHRTLESSFGGSVTDTNLQDLGPVYWKKQARKDLGFEPTDIVMQCKGNVAFKN